MKKMIRLVLLALILMLVPAAAHALDAGALDLYSINASVDSSEWLATDINIVNNLANVLPISDKRYSVLEKRLEALGYVGNGTRSVGFGSKTVSLVIRGGYTSFNFSVLVVDDEVAGVELGIYVDGDRKTDIRKQLKAVLDISEDAITEDEYRIYYIFHFSKPEEVFRERVSRYLGPLTGSLPAEYSADYYLLMDPLEELTYGETCGWAASAPRGREAIERLIAGKQYNLIENILRGYNPEGRVYAAEAVFRIGKEMPVIVSRNREVINKVLSLDIDIGECYGCSHSHKKAHSLLADFLLEDNK